MNENLYFIKSIERAISQRDFRKSLTDAFVEIKSKGSQALYAEGFENFQMFMEIARAYHDDIITDHVRQLIVELATGTFEGTQQEKEVLSHVIRSHPAWMAECRAISRVEGKADGAFDSRPVIALLDEKGQARKVTFTKVPSYESIDDVVPGNCKLKLTNTGWIIWEGELTAKELIWSEAHKSENLRAAAGDTKEEPTNKIDVLNNGELMLRTYARAENGHIEIELTR